MKLATLPWITLTTAGLALAACGDDASPDDSNGNGGNGGTTPTAPTTSEPIPNGSGGNAGAGGTTPMPSGGGGGGTTPATGQYCEPINQGTTANAGCFSYDARVMGIPPDPDLHVSSFTPVESLIGGQPYAMSVNIANRSPTVEIWGSDSPCGNGLELLGTKDVAEPGTHCFELNPTQSYSEVLVVMRGTQANGASVGNPWFCGVSGSCPE